MITETIELLRGGNQYGAGPLTEFAKGKEKMITNFHDAGIKIKRIKEAKLWWKRLSR